MKEQQYRLIIEGDVQGVAYRAYVRRVAKVLRIKGLVRNLQDATVEIYCECNTETLNKFKNKIELKRKNVDDIYSPNVDNIKQFKSNEKEYKKGNFPDEYKSFYVDYGVKLNSFEEESLTRNEIGSLLLIDTNNRTKSVEEEIRAMCDGMVGSFDMVNTKYGSFSKDMKEIKGYIKEFVDIYVKEHKKKNSSK